jgi:hypothetical protein
MGRFLTEQEKINALFTESHDKRIFEIAKELERPQSTLGSSLKTYKSRGTLLPPEKDRRIMINVDVPDRAKQYLLQQVYAKPDSVFGSRRQQPI